MSLIRETPLAVLERVSPHRVEIRFKQGMFINVIGLAAIFEERKRMHGTEEVSLLVIIPDDADLDIAIVGKDQFKANDGVKGLTAMATVAGSTVSETLTELFFAYFPQEFPVQVFKGLGPAREWLDGQDRARAAH